MVVPRCRQRVRCLVVVDVYLIGCIAQTILTTALDSASVVPGGAAEGKRLCLMERGWCH